MKGWYAHLESATDKKTPMTLTDTLRVRLKGITEPAAKIFNRIGFTPNMMTLTGLIGNAIGAYFLAQGQMTIGGLIVFVMGAFDALDGTMARLRGESSNFGAFVDSVTDRYSELVIFGGLLFHYVQHGDWLAAAGVYLAAAGSVLVSYVRARGQSLGMDTKIGILTRFERYIVLAPSLVFNIPLVGIWVTAVLGNITAVQRIWDVRRQARSSK